jgi:hypothetical protein
MADLSKKAIAQVQRFVRTLLQDEIPQQKIAPENIDRCDFHHIFAGTAELC